MIGYARDLWKKIGHGRPTSPSRDLSYPSSAAHFETQRIKIQNDYLAYALFIYLYNVLYTQYLVSLSVCEVLCNMLYHLMSISSLCLMPTHPRSVQSLLAA